MLDVKIPSEAEVAESWRCYGIASSGRCVIMAHFLEQQAAEWPLLSVELRACAERLVELAGRFEEELDEKGQVPQRY